MDNHGGVLPQATGWDHAHLAVKAALSALPVVGAPAAELFATIIAPPLARRRDEWLQSLANGLFSITEKVAGFNAESLAQNEAFVSVTMQASRAALQTHNKEKIEALRNAVLNVAVGRAPDEDEQAVFLSYIETLTTWHIRMLKFFEAPMRMAAARGGRTGHPIGGALEGPLQQVFPELRGRGDFYDQIARDLRARGFLNCAADDALHRMMTDSELSAKRTTEMADRFLAFITSPV